jgi:hypothetical protein
LNCHSDKIVISLLTHTLNEAVNDSLLTESSLVIQDASEADPVLVEIWPSGVREVLEEDEDVAPKAEAAELTSR